MSPHEEYHTVRLPKGWTPARIMEFAKVVDLLGRLGRLGIENAALRRDRRALRKALRTGIMLTQHLDAEMYRGHSGEVEEAAQRALRHFEDALKPRKARRAGRTK